MRIVLVVSVHALAGRAAEIGDAVEELRRESERSPGCEDYRVGRGVDDPSELVVVSTWRDEPSMRAHFASAAYGRYVEAVTPALARPSDVVVHYVDRTVHPIGDASSDPARQG
jgi:quinol monooxygenase YgiN